MTFKEFFLEQRKSGTHSTSMAAALGKNITDGGSLNTVADYQKKKKNPDLIAAKNGGIRPVTPQELKDVYGITDLNDPRLTTTGLVPNGKNPNVIIIKNKFGFFIRGK
jgi:hypothetical protein